MGKMIQFDQFFVEPPTIRPCDVWFRQGPCALAKRMMICGLSFRGECTNLWPFREVLFRGPFAALSKPKSHMEEFYPPSIQMDPELCGTFTSGKQRDCDCTFGPVVSGQYTLQKRSTLHILSPLPGGSTILRPGAISVVNCSNFGEFHVGNSFSTIGKDLPYLRCS